MNLKKVRDGIFLAGAVAAILGLILAHSSTISNAIWRGDENVKENQDTEIGALQSVIEAGFEAAKSERETGFQAAEAERAAGFQAAEAERAAIAKEVRTLTRAVENGVRESRHQDQNLERMIQSERDRIERELQFYREVTKQLEQRIKALEAALK